MTDRSGSREPVLDPPLADTPQGYRMALRRTHERTRRPGLGRLVRMRRRGSSRRAGLRAGLRAGDRARRVRTGHDRRRSWESWRRAATGCRAGTDRQRGGEDEQGEQGPHGASSFRGSRQWSPPKGALSASAIAEAVAGQLQIDRRRGYRTAVADIGRIGRSISATVTSPTASASRSALSSPSIWR